MITNRLKYFFAHKDLLNSYNKLRIQNPYPNRIAMPAIVFPSIFFFFLSFILLPHGLYSLSISLICFYFLGIILYKYNKYISSFFSTITPKKNKAMFEKEFIHNSENTEALMKFIDFKNLAENNQNTILKDIVQESFSYESIYIIHHQYNKKCSTILKNKFLNDSSDTEIETVKESSNTILNFFSKNSKYK